jgi:hypothetical protein
MDNHISLSTFVKIKRMPWVDHLKKIPLLNSRKTKPNQDHLRESFTANQKKE